MLYSLKNYHNQSRTLNMSKTSNYRYSMQSGYTLFEMVITVAIIGILAAIAIPTYQDNSVRAQASEAYRLAYEIKNAIATNTQQGSCFADGAISASVAEGIDKMTGKHGTAMITSTASGVPPCSIHYVFKSSGVSADLKSKTIAMTVSKDGVLAKASATTVDDKYLPQAIK